MSYLVTLLVKSLYHNPPTLARLLKNMPMLPRHALERLLEALGLVLLADADGGDVGGLAYEDEFDPARNGAISAPSLAFCTK